MLSAPRARRLAARIELELDDFPICLLCLSFVSYALEDGSSEPQIRGRLVQFTPILWDEGLEAPARGAVDAAAGRGIEDAATALADLDARGPRTPIARAIVRELAEQLNVRSRAWWAARWN